MEGGGGGGGERERERVSERERESERERGGEKSICILSHNKAYWPEVVSR